MALTEQYNGFQDWPWPLLFETVFEKYGTGARYVLTMRDSPQAWLRSIKDHRMRDKWRRVLTKPNVYGPRYAFGFEAEYLHYYGSHIARVRAFFRERNAGHVLLEACWDRGDGRAELCALLEREVPQAPFPHTNAAAAKKPKPLRRISNAIAAHALARLHGRKITDDLFSGPAR